MTDDRDIPELVARCREGDDVAIEELFKHYVRRLVAIADGRLSARLRRRLDGEDIVQSAFRTFFGRLGRGEYELDTQPELWSLLVAITINKLRKKVEYHSAKKRGFTAEQTVDPDGPPLDFEALSREPTPGQTAELFELIDTVTAGLSEEQRTIFEMRLGGYQMEEIAESVHRSERTVRRTLDRTRATLRATLEVAAPG